MLTDSGEKNSNDVRVFDYNENTDYENVSATGSLSDEEAETENEDSGNCWPDSVKSFSRIFVDLFLYFAYITAFIFYMGPQNVRDNLSSFFAVLISDVLLALMPSVAFYLFLFFFFKKNKASFFNVHAVSLLLILLIKVYVNDL